MEKLIQAIELLVEREPGGEYYCRVREPKELTVGDFYRIIRLISDGIDEMKGE
tara:strand:+ start:1053 stop:1211 length:159 start_codon:yes stop_codon:yes gene_type:complete